MEERRASETGGRLSDGEGERLSDLASSRCFWRPDDGDGESQSLAKWPSFPQLKHRGESKARKILYSILPYITLIDNGTRSFSFQGRYRNMSMVGNYMPQSVITHSLL